MSWGMLSITGATKEDLEAKFDAAALVYKTNLAGADYTLDPAADAQITAAKTAVLALVESGSVGSGTFNVTASGHANPDHKPVKGWANDVISISVSCADPQPAI